MSLSFGGQDYLKWICIKIVLFGFDWIKNNYIINGINKRNLFGDSVFLSASFAGTHNNKFYNKIDFKINTR